MGRVQVEFLATAIALLASSIKLKAVTRIRGDVPWVTLVCLNLVGVIPS
jgi:hypothetical protein